MADILVREQLGCFAIATGWPKMKSGAASVAFTFVKTYFIANQSTRRKENEYP